MTPYKATFDTYEVIILQNEHMRDDSIIEAIGMGSIVIEVMVKCQTKRIKIKDTFYIRKLYANLFSVSKLLSNGLKV